MTAMLAFGGQNALLGSYALSASRTAGSRLLPPTHDLRSFTVLTFGHIRLPMAEDHLYSRSEIQRLAGIDADVLTFWLRRELIRPTRPPEGSGRHFRFERNEVMLAAFFRAARDAGMNVTALQALGEEVRRGITTYFRAAKYRRWLGELANLIEVQFDPFDDFVDRGLLTADDAQGIRSLAPTFAIEDARYLWIGSDLHDGAGRWVAWRDLEGKWNLRSGSPPDGHVQADEPEFYMLFNCDRIFGIHSGMKFREVRDD